MLGLLDHEVLPARAAGSEIERAAGRKHRVAQRIGVELARVRAPEQGVSAVDCLGCLHGGLHGFVHGGGVVHARSLLVCSARHDQLVQRLDRAVHVVTECRREPVEELGLRGLGAHAAEVVRRVGDRAAKVILPHAVHDRAPGERIARIGQPMRERGAARGFVVVWRELELCRKQRGERGQRRGLDDLAWRCHLTAREHADLARLAATRAGADECPRARVHRARVDELGRGQRGERLRRVREFGVGVGARIARGGVEHAIAERDALRLQRSEFARAFLQSLRIRVYRGIDAVGEVHAPPAFGVFDAVGAGDDRAERDVALRRVDRLQLREREDEVVLARRERGRGHADVARNRALGVEALRRDARRASFALVAHGDRVHARRISGIESSVITRLDAERARESEPVADPVEVVVARREHDRVDRDRAPEVDLHPFLLGVRVERDLAVIAELGRVRASWLAGRGDRAVERDEFVARRLRERVVDARKLRRRLGAGRGERGALRGDRGIRVERLVRAVDRREHRLQRVVVVLRHRIELVVVALRALHRHAREGADRVAHHVVAVEVPRELAVDLVLADFLVPDEIPRSRRDEPERLDAVAGVRIERVACELLLDKARVRLVVVERADDIVAVRPRVVARLVLVVAVRVGVVHDVEPVPRPALAVARRREQAIDEAFVLVDRGIGDVRIDLVRRGRQSDEVEVHAPTERACVGFGRHGERVFRELRGDERVDGIRACVLRVRRRQGGLHDRLEAPPIERVRDLHARRRGPVGAVVDPAADHADLGIGQWRAPVLRVWRHPHVWLQPRDVAHERTRGAVAGPDVRRRRLAAVERHALHIEPKAALLLLRSVAGQAARGKDRRDVALEVDGLRSGRGQLGSLQAGACGQADDERRKRQDRSLLEGAAPAKLILPESLHGIGALAPSECR